MPTNYTASMSISNLIRPTSFIYQGTELATTLATYQPLISIYNIIGATGGSMNISAGILTLTMPTNYTGNFNVSGVITTSSITSTSTSTHSYFGGTSSTGLRIAGWDSGNTIYQQNNLNLGLTTNSTTANITFAIGSGNTILTISNSSATVKGSIITNTSNNSLISYFYPTPYNNGSTSINQAANCYVNLCAATTAGFAQVFPYLSVVCSDIENDIGTILYL